MAVKTDRRYVIRWCLLGALLSTGAPLGLWAVLALLADGAADPRLIYGYTAGATLVAFVAFGAFAGRLMDRLHAIARRDSLTGLLNRGHWLDAVRRTLAEEVVDGAAALLLIDVDHFKRVNDDFGHLVGDRVLVAVALTIQRNTRSPDVVGRYGGEEFVVFCPGVLILDALAIAERIRAAVERLDLSRIACTRSISVSIGVATAGTRAACQLTGLIDRADASMYRAKRAGRNRVCSSDDTK